MSNIEEIRKLLQSCNPDERRQVFDELRQSIDLHPFEKAMGVKAEVILEALGRAPDLTIRGVRGIIGEATFAIGLVPKLVGWQDVTPVGNYSYDAALKDSVGTVTVQVKMQRRENGNNPRLRNGVGAVEVQRTRGGSRNGEDTRPYRFGTFDILAVCMEPSHKRWDSFLYIPERWLLPRKEDPSLIDIMQPLPLEPDGVWTSEFPEVVKRLRSGRPRP